MAREIAHATAVIDLSVNGSESAKKKLESIANIKEKIEKNNIIQYKIEIGKDGALKLKKLQTELNKDGQNLMKVIVPDEFFSKYSDLIGESTDKAENFLEILNQIRSNDGFGSGSGSVSPELQSLNEQLEKQKKILKDSSDAIVNYKKELDNLNSNSSIEDIDKKISELKKKKGAVAK